MFPSFTLDQLQNLPSNFQITHQDRTVLFVEQDLRNPQERNCNLVFNEWRFSKKGVHGLEYVFDKTDDGTFRVHRCGEKGWFAGHTQEKIDTKRAYFELWRNLNIRNEWTERYALYIKKILHLELPSEWEGATLEKRVDRFDLIDVISGAEPIIDLWYYSTPIGFARIQFCHTGQIRVNYKNKGTNLDELLALTDHAIQKFRSRILLSQHGK